MKNKTIVYKPVCFIALTFCVTWTCIFFLAYQPWLKSDRFIDTAILTFVDFLKSASPLLVAFFLLRKSLSSKNDLLRFVFGDKSTLLAYVTIVSLFAFQFFTFYFFRLQVSSSISLMTFAGAWLGQILLGGGMEEGGWRGYLQPAFENKVHTLVGVVLVSAVWSCWHLPYFFLPDTFQTGSNFLFYFVTSTATAFTLTAIYKMTGSILLCSLFHGWQNAIVMSFPADMGHPGFVSMFVLQTVVSIILCIKPIGRYVASQPKGLQ